MPAKKDGYHQLFVARTHHRPIAVDQGDRATGSRLGGRPPLPLAKKPPRCPICKGALQYVLTLAADTLGAAIAGERALSLLTCRDFGCRQGSHELAYPSPTLLVAHPDEARAETASELDPDCEGRALSMGELTIDPLQNGEVYTDASKLGGGPGYIQGWGDQEAQKARARGAEFLFQWSENSLAAAHVEIDEAPFANGVVYVFARIDANSGRPTLEDLAAFWQSS